MDSPDPLAGHVLVMFDGVCNLCNGFVQFVIRRDPGARFRFASLQSDFGHEQLRRHGLDPNTLHSVIVIDDGKMYQRSDAVLRVVRYLPGLWPMLKALVIVPRPLRDVVYNLIATSRYRWFGKRAVCMVPDPSLKSRFLE
ncbi:MAG TPA: thiol-disulfide oxidoreductase DCC family protein [Chryseolinea sp.]|nr:thiol-disulfide oxidoreductase DCC family protein [Chryseolinea sp.]